MIRCDFYPNFEHTHTKFKIQYDRGDGKLYDRIESITCLNFVGRAHTDVDPTVPLGGGVELRPDPQNQHDPNAIGVYFEEKRFGYVAAGQTHLIRQWQKNPKILFVNSLMNLYAVAMKE